MRGSRGLLKLGSMEKGFSVEVEGSGAARGTWILDGVRMEPWEADSTGGKIDDCGADIPLNAPSNGLPWLVSELPVMLESPIMNSAVDPDGLDPGRTITLVLGPRALSVPGSG